MGCSLFIHAYRLLTLRQNHLGGVVSIYIPYVIATGPPLYILNLTRVLPGYLDIGILFYYSGLKISPWLLPWSRISS